jgi:hypothetical protein
MKHRISFYIVQCVGNSIISLFYSELEESNFIRA